MDDDGLNEHQDDSDRLGRLAIQSLALLGGLAGVIIAVFHLTASEIGSSSSHIAWSDLILVAGIAFLLFGAAGISGAFLYTRYEKLVGWLLISCGLLGFPVGYVAWSNWVGFLGWAVWIPAGVLLAGAGLLALVTPEHLRSRLLGQESSLDGTAVDRSPIDQALFVGVVLAGVGLLAVIFLISGIIVFGAEDALKDDATRDQEDFDNADLAASMGRWDTSVESYDDILSRNQSNLRAWKERAYALQKLGRYDEAAKSYERACQLDPGDETLQEDLNRAQSDMQRFMEQNNSTSATAKPAL